MAFHKKRPAQINRTPAPDEITNIRKPGAFSAGTNGPQPSSVDPGIASESILGQNLRESQDDGEDVLGQVISKGTAGRGDGINPQTRAVSATMYEGSVGAKRQQHDLADIGKASLPRTLGASATKEPQ